MSLANRSTAGVVLASNMKIFQDIKHLSVRLGMEEGLRNKRRYITFDLSKKFWPFVFLRNKERIIIIIVKFFWLCKRWFQADKD